MYEIKEQATISGDLATVWTVATDVANWPAWDPHEEDARLGALHGRDVRLVQAARRPGRDLDAHRGRRAAPVGVGMRRTGREAGW